MKNILSVRQAEALTCDDVAYEYNGHTYYLTEVPYLDQDCYTAGAVRVGDEIDDGEVAVHDLHWDLITPKQHGYRVCGSTAISAENEKGFLTEDELSKKYGIITVADDGQYIPIEPPVLEDGMTFCKALRNDDSLDDDGDIRIYAVSFFESKDPIDYRETKHGEEGRQVVSYNGKAFLLNDCDVQSYLPFKDNEWYIEEAYVCDWGHPSSVSEDVGYVSVKAKELNHKQALSR